MHAYPNGSSLHVSNSKCPTFLNPCLYWAMFAGALFFYWATLHLPATPGPGIILHIGPAMPESVQTRPAATWKGIAGAQGLHNDQNWQAADHSCWVNWIFPLVLQSPPKIQGKDWCQSFMESQLFSIEVFRGKKMDHNFPTLTFVWKIIHLCAMPLKPQRNNLTASKYGQKTFPHYSWEDGPPKEHIGKCLELNKYGFIIITLSFATQKIILQWQTMPGFRFCIRAQWINVRLSYYKDSSTFFLV